MTDMMKTSPSTNYYEQIRWNGLIRLNNFKKVLLCLLIISSASGYGQNLAELEKRNGFKDIKLGMVVDSLKGIKFKKEFMEREEFPAKLYTVEHPDYEKIGEVKI